MPKEDEECSQQPYFSLCADRKPSSMPWTHLTPCRCHRHRLENTIWELVFWEHDIASETLQNSQITGTVVLAPLLHCFQAQAFTSPYLNQSVSVLILVLNSCNDFLKVDELDLSHGIEWQSFVQGTTWPNGDHQTPWPNAMDISVKHNVRTACMPIHDKIWQKPTLRFWSPWKAFKKQGRPHDLYLTASDTASIYHFPLILKKFCSNNGGKWDPIGNGLITIPSWSFIEQNHAKSSKATQVTQQNHTIIGRLGSTPSIELQYRLCPFPVRKELNYGPQVTFLQFPQPKFVFEDIWAAGSSSSVKVWWMLPISLHNQSPFETKGHKTC